MVVSLLAGSENQQILARVLGLFSRLSHFTGQIGF